MPVHNLPYSVRLAGETFELPGQLDDIDEALSSYVLYSEYEAEISDSLGLISEGLDQLPDEYHPFLAVLRTRQYNVEQKLSRGLLLDAAISETLDTGSMARAQMVTAYGIITAEMALTQLANWIYSLENDLFEEEQSFSIHHVKLTNSKQNDPKVYSQFIREHRASRYLEEIEVIKGSANYQGRARYLYLMARTYDGLTEDQKAAEAYRLGAAQRDIENKKTLSSRGSKTPRKYLWIKRYITENLESHAYRGTGEIKTQHALATELHEVILPAELKREIAVWNQKKESKSYTKEELGPPPELVKKFNTLYLDWLPNLGFDALPPRKP